MGDGFGQGLGSFAGGLAQGVARGQQLALQREALKRQEEEAKLRGKLFDLQLKQFQEKVQAGQGLQDFFAQFGGPVPDATDAPPGAFGTPEHGTMGPIPGQPIPTTPGPSATPTPRAAAGPAAGGVTLTPQQQALLRAAAQADPKAALALLEKMAPGLFPGSADAPKPVTLSEGQALVDPTTGQTITERAKAPEKPRQASQDRDDIADAMFDKPYRDLTNPQQEQVNARIQQDAVARATALGQAQAGIQQIPQGVQGEIASLEELLATSQELGHLFKPDFVGPIAGRAAGVRERTVGLDEQEAEFRAVAANLKNVLLLARSGGAVSDQEGKRLEAEIPDPNLPPVVFESRRRRFEAQVARMIERKKRLAGTSRGELAASAGAAPPARPSPADVAAGVTQQRSPGPAGTTPTKQRVLNGKTYVEIDGVWHVVEP